MDTQEVAVVIETMRYHGEPTDRKVVTRTLRREGQFGRCEMRVAGRLAVLTMDPRGNVAAYVSDGGDMLLDEEVKAP